VRIIELNKSKRLSMMKGDCFIPEKEMDLPKGLIPGEWVLFHYKQTEFYAGMVNTFAQKPLAYLVERLTKTQFYVAEKILEDAFALTSIEKNLTRALDYRSMLPYGWNARLVFGGADKLPGMIVDGYKNAVLVQINTAGMDRFRGKIQSLLETRVGVPIYFMDHAGQREKEQLPVHENKLLPEQIEVQDYEFQLVINKNTWQKNGYYYDHRENRKKFYLKLTELKLDKHKALDLFCYHGSWGITALKAGVKWVDFVDQADLKEHIDQHLHFNNLSGLGDVHRTNVFDFLDELKARQATYNVVISDPPPFAKSFDKKFQALDGYKKLHTKILKVLAPKSLVVFASCTHYVSMEEFERSILDSADQLSCQLRLLDVGIQALDHPISNFNDKSNYIKFLLYEVEMTHEQFT
jgi:23S rRNA (cytosine1962-C5)-methyltransferase